MENALRRLVAHRRLTARLLWDVFMVWVALVNLGLIVFDLTYLLLRPTYIRWLPPVTAVYDRVKGIEPHPLTAELAAAITETARALEHAAGPEEVARRVDRLVELTSRVLTENPFERSGQARQLEVLRLVVAHEAGMASEALARPAASAEAAARFWPHEPAALARRLAQATATIVPLLELNYFREFDFDGRLVDHFWIIDLPFLAFFWVEFAIRWLLSVRRREHARWFFFPLLNWYDVLGLVPSHGFRAFRLLRAVSMYMRLRRSRLSKVGKDALSRAVAWVSNVLTEEVSDRVFLRILNEYQEEIRDGTHRRIIRATLGARRAEIERVLADQLLVVLTDPRAQSRFRRLLELNLDTAVESAETLRSLPLPDPLLRPVVRAVGEAVLAATADAVEATLASDEGQAMVAELVHAVVDQVASGPGLDELESLTREVSLDVIEHMKRTVAVRKWARAPRDEPPA